MQDSRTTEMIKKGQEIIKKINTGEMKISDMKAEPLPPMNQEGNLSHVSVVSRRFKTGDFVMIKRDTTKFLKENNYWLEEYDTAGIHSIDGMIGIIKNDYTNLPEHESHYVVALVNIDMSGIGIHPDYIMAI